MSGDEARDRLSRYGSNLLKPRKRSDSFTLLLAQFKSPLALILFFATGLSFFLGNAVDAFIILAIVLASGLLGFWQERGASNAVEKLLSIVRIKADGQWPCSEPSRRDCLLRHCHPSAGDIIPETAWCWSPKISPMKPS